MGLSPRFLALSTATVGKMSGNWGIAAPLRAMTVDDVRHRAAGWLASEIEGARDEAPPTVVGALTLAEEMENLGE